MCPSYGFNKGVFFLFTAASNIVFNNAHSMISVVLFIFGIALHQQNYKNIDCDSFNLFNFILGSRLVKKHSLWLWNSLIPLLVFLDVDHWVVIPSNRFQRDSGKLLQQLKTCFCCYALIWFVDFIYVLVNWKWEIFHLRKKSIFSFHNTKKRKENFPTCKLLRFFAKCET